ncbi:putative NADH:ubiquinone reductase (H(+)-translocating) [Helianthus debilis subsp. tardiflorus]
MILGVLAAKAQTKVTRLLAQSSIGHVGYIRTGFSCGTIKGIQFTTNWYLYLCINDDRCIRHSFSITAKPCQIYIGFGRSSQNESFSAITFSITMFSYAGIPPLAGFCSKFYLFFAALGCGAYFLAPVGIVTSVIGRWAAGRLPRVSQFGGPKADLRVPDT